MKIVLAIIICLALLKGALGQVNDTCTISDGNIIKLGSRVYICAKIVTSSDTFVYALGVTVDKLTALEITKLNEIVSSNQRITLSLQYQGVSTTQQIVIQDYTSGVYLNPISIVLEVKTGVLSQIYYDKQDCTSCYAQNSKTCINDQCFSAGSLLTSNNLIIYLSWIGTDLVGNHFISHTLRLNKLSLFSQQDVYSSALVLTTTQ